MNVKKFVDAVLLACVVLIIAGPVSCKITSGGIKILEGDFTVPVLEDVKVTGACEMLLSFSKCVVLKGLVLCSDGVCCNVTASASAEVLCAQQMSFGGTDVSGGTEESSGAARTSSEPGGISCTTQRLTFSRKTEVGKSYELRGIAEDKNGNTLSFSIPFTGYNENVPVMVFSEIRNSAKPGEYRYEFIEFYVIKSGNTSGLEYISAGDGEKKKYAFPNMEVSAGEYIVLHMRTPSETDTSADLEIFADETGDDLNLSSAPDSVSGARDLWLRDTTAKIAASDMLLLVNTLNDSVLDAVLFCQSSLTEWKSTFTSYAEKVKASGVWTDEWGDPSAELSSAVLFEGYDNLKRSLSRQNISELTEENHVSCKTQWIVAGKNGVDCTTPGSPNSDVVFVKKS